MAQTADSQVDERGQATVELALVLPVLVLLLFAVAQVGLVVRSQLLVIHAAREAARVVAVDPAADAHQAAAQAAGLAPERLEVDAVGQVPGAPVTVRVTYRQPVELPFVGVVAEPVLSASVVMIVEGPPP